MKFAFFATAAASMLISPVAFAQAQAPAAAAVSIKANTGKMLFSTDGKRIGAVYRVTADGSPQVILNSRLVTVPVATISEVDGKLTTSISKRDLIKSK